MSPLGVVCTQRQKRRSAVTDIQRWVQHSVHQPNRRRTMVYRVV
jgi:hypothetical protein